MNGPCAIQTWFKLNAMDPNDLICMAWRWQRGDVRPITGGDLKEALWAPYGKDLCHAGGRGHAFSERAIAKPSKKMIAGSELRTLSRIDGHLALFGADADFLGQVDRTPKNLLASNA
jgi:homoserine O-acetyltransferase/O-succinyltransferase